MEVEAGRMEEEGDVEVDDPFEEGVAEVEEAAVVEVVEVEEGGEEGEEGEKLGASGTPPVVD